MTAPPTPPSFPLKTPHPTPPGPGARCRQVPRQPPAGRQLGPLPHRDVVQPALHDALAHRHGAPGQGGYGECASGALPCPRCASLAPQTCADSTGIRAGCAAITLPACRLPASHAARHLFSRGREASRTPPPPRPAPQGATPQECQKHLHQLHVCLPARAGHTRLLYRMATDFLGWTEWIPGVQSFWRYIAAQVRLGTAGAPAAPAALVLLPMQVALAGPAPRLRSCNDCAPVPCRCWARIWCWWWASRTGCCAAATPGATRCRTTSWRCDTAAGATRWGE